jgi:hypothetical protein
MKQVSTEYLPENHGQESLDENYDTPLEAVLALQDNLLRPGREQAIWEPCDPYGNSNISRRFRQAGHRVIATGLPELDFLRQKKPLENVKCVITNPPYSLKDQFLEKCFSFEIPFCLLLPITALEGVRRGLLFREHGIQVLVLDRRVQLIRGKNVYFNTSWFCWSPKQRLLRQDLVFARLPELRQAA